MICLASCGVSRNGKYAWTVSKGGAILPGMESLRKKACPMKSRVDALETDVAAIRQDLAVVLSNYVTKADLHHEIGKLTWKIITWTTGICSALTAAVYFIARTGA
ncbi:hypothetical protein [Bordetella petrii]|uniref:hypothetical protein n=1 Tax=Bordetella petrii TaxID=94624 RepID=UPI001E53343F|nr:hypothetical protein [Bordetella petrii]MCD0504754.1 hypothetical protein [Bordetella petrii]